MLQSSVCLGGVHLSSALYGHMTVWCILYSTLMDVRSSDQSFSDCNQKCRMSAVLHCGSVKVELETYSSKSFINRQCTCGHYDDKDVVGYT